MTEAPSIQLCLSEVKNAVGAVGKSQRNTAQNFNFRGVDAVVNAAAPALNKFGVIIIPQVVSHVYEQVTTSAGKQAAHVIVEVDYQFHGPAGDFLIARVIAESMDFGDKAVAKAMSVAYRTALLQVLNLPTDEKDPDEEVFERSGSAPKDSSPTRSGSSTAGASAGIEGLILAASKATTANTLLNVWKAAGTAGKLQEEIAHPKTAEKMTFEKYLQTRNDELALAKSSGAGTSGTRGSGSK